MSKKPLRIVPSPPSPGDDATDSAAILARRDELMRKLRRNATAMAGVVLSASACPCLEVAGPPVQECPDASLPDGGRRSVGLEGCDEVMDGGARDGGTDLDGGTRDGNGS